MSETYRDDHQTPREAGDTMPGHLKTGTAPVRNGVPILPTRREEITPSHVQEILDEEGI